MSSEFDQVPFSHGIVPYDGAIFAENPEPRCPCLLLLDTSGSMQGAPILELNAGLVGLKDELMTDPLAIKRVELAIVTFGPVEVVTDFESVDIFQPPTLQASGDTPMGTAIERGIAMVRARKDAYRLNGIEYYRPWVFLITDGAPTDNWHGARNLVHQGEKEKQFQFFAVGVQNANFDILAQLSTRQPLRLDGLRFRDLFAWLSNSLSSVSHSQVGTQVQIENPTVPGGWGSVG